MPVLGDTSLFFMLWLQKPLQIAAVCPSSARLAAAMAALIDPARPGPVLELGAGSGSLTRGLVDAGWPTERIIAHEREARLAAILERDLPGIATIIGDAADLERQLAERGIDRLSAVVSSLPIKWFALPLQRAVVEPCFARLGPRGRFLQVTNAFVSPLAVEPLGIAGREAARVWRNLPPAQIWAYSATARISIEEGR